MTVTHPEWIQKLFAAIDAKNPDAFVSFLTPGGRFTFGNLPAAVGQAEVAKAVGGFFASLGGLKHTLRSVWQTPAAAVVEGEVTYTRLDGSTLTVPFCDVLDLADGKIADYRIYMDVSQLYR